MGKRSTVTFLLDMSASMTPQRKEVITAFNAFIKDQAELRDKCRLIFSRFNSMNTATEILKNIQDTGELLWEEYVPGGDTPLLDAVWDAIVQTKENAKGNVLFVIYTDGEENRSRRTTKEQLKAEILKCREQGWEFIFMGTDIDAYADAAQYGIPASHTVSMVGAQGPIGPMQAASDVASSYRTTGTADMDALKEEEARQKAESSS